MNKYKSHFLRVSSCLKDNINCKEITEYVDIIVSDKNVDEELFLDLYTIIHLKSNDVGFEFKDRIIKKVDTFFVEILNAIIIGDETKLASLSKYLHEPKYTKLGYSIIGTGSALGEKKFKKLIDSLKSSDAVKTKSIEDILDTELYVKDIGVDIISDLITNLIQDVLGEYTAMVLNSHIKGNEIRYIETHYWDENNKEWAIKEIPMLNYKINIDSIIEDNFLLVPKSFTADKHQKSKIIKNIFDNCIFDLYKSRILSDTAKYSNYINEKDVVYKKKVIECIKDELGNECGDSNNKHITSHGLMNLIALYPKIKEYINNNIKN